MCPSLLVEGVGVSLILPIASFLFLSTSAVVVTAQAPWNCPSVVPQYGVNCTGQPNSQCCGAQTMSPQCINASLQCCQWYIASAVCSLAEVCCGQSGYGASSNAFCCPPTTQCCATTEDGGSQCCGEGQFCCRGYNSVCCDSATEECDSREGVCRPKPGPPPPGIAWRVNLYGQVPAPSVLNETHLATGGNSTYVIAKATGAISQRAATSYTFMTPTSGHVTTNGPEHRPVTKFYVFSCGSYSNTMAAIDTALPCQHGVGPHKQETCVVWNSDMSCGPSLYMPNQQIVVSLAQAYDAVSGDMLWSIAGVMPSYNIAGVQWRPGGNRILFTSSANPAVVGAASAATGKFHWLYNFTLPGLLLSLPIVIPQSAAFPRALVVTGSVAALDALTGAVVWTYNAGTVPTGLAYLGTVVYGVNGTNVFAVSASHAGQPLWSIPLAASAIHAASDDTNGALQWVIVVGTGDYSSHWLASLDPASGSVLWNVTLAGTITGTSTLSGSHRIALVHVAGGGPSPYALLSISLRTGKQVATWEMGAPMNEAPVIDKNAGLVYFGSDDFFLYAGNLVKG